MQLTPAPLSTGVAVPFLKEVLIPLGWFFIPFAAFVMVGASNAVNLTDGLDGLAIVPVMIAAACFSLIAYLVGNSVFAEYLQLHFVPRTGELAVFCGALCRRRARLPLVQRAAGHGLHGRYRLALAWAVRLGAISVITKHELVLAIIGGLFVLETVSVVVQVVSFKTTGRASS